MEAMDGASAAADNGGSKDAVAVPLATGVAAPAGAEGVVTNTSSEGAPPAAVAGNASGTDNSSEGPRAEAEEDQMKRAADAVDEKGDDDDNSGDSPTVIVLPPADDVQTCSSPDKHGTSTASGEVSASTPMVGTAETPAVGAVDNAGGDSKKSAKAVEEIDNSSGEEYPTWSTDDLMTWQISQSGTRTDGGGCSAIDDCSNFVKNHLMTKNCADILAIQGSGAFHVCACMKNLDPSLARPAATFVAVTWANMTESERVDQLYRWMYGPPYGSFELPMESDPMDDDDSQLAPSSESRLICNNALIELLGISSHLWQKALDHEVKDGATDEAVASSKIDEDRSPSKKGGRRAKRPTINSILRLRKSGKGFQSDQEAIDACEAFIRTHLLTKTCTSNNGSTKCTCMQTLTSAIDSERTSIRSAAIYVPTMQTLGYAIDSEGNSIRSAAIYVPTMQTLGFAIDSQSNSIRSAATYVATTWYNMSDEDKTAQIVEWIRDKKNQYIAFILPGTNEKMICRNALCEVLGISPKKWRKAAKLQEPSDGLNDEGSDSVILKTFASMIQSAGPRAVEVCANFIRSYLMRKTCRNVASNDRTQCTCLQSLTPDQIHQSASYVATVWYDMTHEEKLNELGNWIQQKDDGALPFLLPVGESTKTAVVPTKICRNALCEILFVPATWWKKAEKQAKPTIRKAQCSVGGCTRQSRGPICEGMCKRHFNEKKMGAKSTPNDVVAGAAAGSTQVTEKLSGGSNAIDPPRSPFAVVLEKPMGLTLIQRGQNIQVSAIKPGSIAERSGKVSIGNVILAVNGKGVMNKDLSGVADMINKGGSTVNILFLSGDSEQQQRSDARIYEVSTSSAALISNKTTLSIENAASGREITDQSSVTAATGSASLEESVARRGPLCSVNGCTRESQGLKCKGMCRRHYYEKYPTPKSICTDVTPVKSAREKNQSDERVVERAIAATAKGRDSTVLQTLIAVVESAGPMAIDVCSNFIQSHLMQRTCSDWSRSSCKATQCTCMQTLNPDQIRSSAIFVATSWCKMTQEEKVDQLALWIQQKGDGVLPYCLPVLESPSGRPASSTKICRNALCAVLFVPTTLWKKAEERAEDSSSNVDEPEKTMAKRAAATGALDTGPDASIAQGQDSNSNVKEARKEVAPTKAAVAVARVETDANDANDRAVGDQEPPSKGVKKLNEEVSLSTDRNIDAAAMKNAGGVGPDGCPNARQDTWRGTPRKNRPKHRGTISLPELPTAKRQPAKRSLSGATAIVGNSQAASTGKSAPNCTSGIYGALNKMVETSGLQAVEACSRYIRSYVMQQACNDWVSSTRTGCVCARTLTPAEVCEAATYVTTTWYEKSEEEKIDQLALWIQQKKSGDLPFSLPSFQRVGLTGEPTRLCRGAFMKLLFIPASMWRKAEARASPSAAIDSEKKSFVCALDKPPEERVRVAVNCFGKAFPCSFTGCPNFSQSKCPGMCLSHFNKSAAQKRTSVGQESCNKVEKVNAAARKSGADNISTTKPKGTITITTTPKDIVSSAKKPTTEKVATNPVRRINQECAIKPAPLTSFVVALTKPMGITLLQNSASGRIRVAAIKTGSPAERSGKVSIGNILLAVNGRDVTNMVVDDVVKMIKNGRSISDCLLLSAEKSAQSGDAYTYVDAKSSTSQGHYQRIRGPKNLSNVANVASPIGNSGKRESHYHCSVEGCLKYSQRNCRGMCVSHFKESKAEGSATSIVVDSPKNRDRIDRAGLSASASANFVTPSPAKKGAAKKCSVEGCSKYKQRDNNGMCRAHYLESQTKADNSIGIANFGRRRIESRKPTRSHCGSCDACMVDECGECKHCLDMPRFGGKWKLRQKCMSRPACIARGSLNSPLHAKICSEIDAQSTRKSGGKRKRSDSTPVTQSSYTPPTIAVGEKIMKFFTDDFYEGKVERLPTKASSLFFVVYNDGDREELDEDGFWAAYSDYRVQKGMIRPSEFVPESLVVANDGRLGEVLSFRPISNGVDTTWSYRVHFTGWSSTFDKWMLEVDLRKQTKATLKWAEKVRTSLGIKDRSKKRMKREGNSSAPASKGALSESVVARKVVETTQRPSRGEHSYPLRSVPSPKTKKKTLPSRKLKQSFRSTKATSAESTSMKRPAKAAKTKSSPSRSIGCDVVMRQYPLRSSEPHLRRAAVDAKRKLSTSRKEVPKQTKKAVQRKNLTSKPRPGDDKKASVVDADNYILPTIAIGTSILKYFFEGKDYFEGKITKLPTPTKNFYRIRYHDGDEEDMDPLELYMAFSDWCVANNEIPLTKFNPKQHVYAVDCGGVVREAVILSFCPVLKPGCMPGEWSWSYRVHFVGWHKRHDEWLDEDRLRKISASSTKEKFQKQIDEEREKQAEASAKESTKTPAKQANAGQKRGREATAKVKHTTPSVKKYRWRCHRCDELNDPNKARCFGCQGWKGGKRLRMEDSEVVEVLDESEAEDESSEEEEESPAVSSRCIVDGCNKYKRSGNDGMCRSHFRESQEVDEEESSEEEEIEEESSEEESSEEDEEEEFSEEDEESSDDESSDEEGMLNWRQRKRLTCAAEGCTRLRQFGQYGTLCRIHFLEAQEAGNSSNDNDVDAVDSGDEADPEVVAKDHADVGNEDEEGTKDMEGDVDAASTVGAERPSSVVTAFSGSSGLLSGGQSSSAVSNLMDMIQILKDSDDEDDNDDEDLFA